MTVVAILVLLLVLCFLVGWIAPLVVGIVRRRRGTPSVGLLVFGGCWGSLALALTVLIGIGTYTALRVAQNYRAEEFVLEAYTGAVASIDFSYKGASTLTALNEADGKNYNYTSSNGVHTLPAVSHKLSSYTINLMDDNEKPWFVSGSFYGVDNEKRLDLKEGEVSRLKLGPPLAVTVTRGDLEDGEHRLDVAVKDADGNNVSLRSLEPLKIEILNAQDEVLWSAALEYG